MTIVVPGEQGISLLRDNKVSLNEKVQLALQQYQGDDTVVFPARDQYLLDWLLETLFRLVLLFKDENYWQLVISLLTPSDTSRRKVIFNRPIALFLSVPLAQLKEELYSDASIQNHFEQVIAIIIKYHLDTFCRSTQDAVVLDMVGQSVSVFESLLGMLCQWALAQSTTNLTLFTKFHPVIKSLIPKVASETLQTSLFKSFILRPEVVKVYSTQQGHVLDVIRLFSDPFASFRALCEQLADRSMIVESFATLATANMSSSFVSNLIKALVTINFSSIQSDDAWRRLIEVTCSILTTFNYSMDIVAALANLDYALVKGHLESIIQTTSNDSHVLDLINASIKARHFDELILMMVRTNSEFISFSRLDSLARCFKALSPQVQVRLVEQIISLATQTSDENSGGHQLLSCFIPWLGTRKIDDIHAKLADNPSTKALAQSLLLFTSNPYTEDQFLKEDPVYLPLTHSIQAAKRVKLSESPVNGAKYSIFWESININELMEAILASPLDYDMAILEYLPKACPAEPSLVARLLETLFFTLSRWAIDNLIVCAPAALSLISDGVLLDVFDFTKHLVTGSVWKASLSVLSPEKILTLVPKVNLESRHPDCISSLVSLLEALPIGSTIPNSFITYPSTFERHHVPILMQLYRLKSEQFSSMIRSMVEDDPSLGMEVFMMSMEMGIESPVSVSLSDMIDKYFIDQSVDPMRLATIISALQDLEQQKSIIQGLGGRAPMDRTLGLLDALLTRDIETQLLASEVVDQILSYQSARVSAHNQLRLLSVIARRVIVGREAMNRLGNDSNLFLKILEVMQTGPKTNVETTCDILSSMMQHFWPLVIKMRPIVISIMIQLVGVCGEATSSLRNVRMVARMLNAFASHRQSDQHFYLTPLLIHFVHVSLTAEVRAILQPSFCQLLRHVDLAASAAKATGKVKDDDKYFRLDPFEIMARHTHSHHEGDVSGEDARMLLKSLIETYKSEYRYSGKA